MTVPSRRARRVARRRARAQAADMPRRRAWRSLLEYVCDGDQWLVDRYRDPGMGSPRRAVHVDPTVTPPALLVTPAIVAPRASR